MLWYSCWHRKHCRRIRRGLRWVCRWACRWRVYRRRRKTWCWVGAIRVMEELGLMGKSWTKRAPATKSRGRGSCRKDQKIQEKRNDLLIEWSLTIGLALNEERRDNETKVQQ